MNNQQEIPETSGIIPSKRVVPEDYLRKPEKTGNVLSSSDNLFLENTIKEFNRSQKSLKQSSSIA
jgi:hypothetical protein